MKKYLIYAGIAIVVIFTGYYSFIRYVAYSDGYRAGELIKVSHKGFLFKTWEGELSQGVSESQFFQFSVTDDDVVEQLKTLQGQHVKLTYEERYRTFPWWGDTKYFIIKAEESNLPSAD